ncbi:MAG TPA: isoprenylcysteine carboxylmethyltransferase family protein [Pyrinomonadaceae bacterium]|nr:isoprenylcysteine carboxylmethyltransferase family protein [Pyrinomonadaceae bacterium]
MSFFDYFQIASVALFSLIILVKTLYLRLKRNINPIAIGGGKRGLVLAVEVFAFTALLAWMVEILLYAFHSEFRIFPWPLDIQLIDSLVAKLIGVVLISIGCVLFIMAYVSFGDSWRVGFDVKSPGALVTTGVFSISRNPIYLFLNLWFIGTFLINGGLIFLIFAILAVVVQHWQILQEEAFLTNLYGQPYKNYLARTGRYVGFSG